VGLTGRRLSSTAAEHDTRKLKRYSTVRYSRFLLVVLAIGLPLLFLLVLSLFLLPLVH
jgi:hypothetical protein